jgi:hypothetical protein
MAVVFLILFVLIMIIVGVALIIYAYRQSIINGGNTVFKTPCNQAVDISSLVQIPSSFPVCIQNGKPTNLFYIGFLSNGKYDMVVAPYATPALDVCVGYCDKYLEGICMGPSFNGKSAQANFDQCLSLLTNPNCSGIPPIAAKGTILYYGQSVTSRTCGIREMTD